MPGKDMAAGGKGYGVAGAIAYHMVRMGLKLSRLSLAGALINRFAARKRLKVVTIPVDAAINRNPAILPFDAAKRLIEASSYIAATDVCMCREAHGCREYPVDLGCLFLGPGARNMSLHGRIHPISKDEALAHLERARSFGLVSNVIWSRAELRALGADPATTVELCSCCPCCCLAFKTKDASRAFLDGITGLGVAKVVTPDECTRCTNCVPACPFGAIRIDMSAGPLIDTGRCKGCGRCESACKPRALKIFSVEPAGGTMPLPGTMYLEEFLEMVR
jgi:Dissimilatory sulfite reductase (desulfoviridin), alpha and beta subunits